MARSIPNTDGGDLDILDVWLALFPVCTCLCSLPLYFFFVSRMISTPGFLFALSDFLFTGAFDVRFYLVAVISPRDDGLMADQLMCTHHR